MCQVDSFCCGCAPLRKGALIIGSVKLVLALIQVAYVGWMLISLLPHINSGRDEVTMTLVILGVVEVVLIISAIANILLIMAARSGKEGGGHTLPWLIICVISIVFGVLAILGKSWISIPDVALSIYFFIVIKSYRAELKEGGQVTV